MKTYTIRLVKGDDLKQSLLNFINNNDIKAAVVLSSVGSLTHINIRLAQAKDFLICKKDYEIISLNGTLGNNSCHLHISISDNKGQVFGGHLNIGTIINTTCELVLLELNDCSFIREYDPNTGYNELVIKKK